MGIDALIGLILVYIVIIIWKGGEWAKKKAKHICAEESPKYGPCGFLDEKIDNQGYEPYSGNIHHFKGTYSTIIYRDKDHKETEFLEASSVEELKRKAYPILKERSETWRKRQAEKKKRKEREAQS